MISWILIVAVTIPIFLVGLIAGFWSGVMTRTEMKFGDRVEWPLDCRPLWLTSKSLFILIVSELVGQVFIFGLTWYLKSLWVAIVFIIAYYFLAKLTCRRLFTSWFRQHTKQIVRAERWRHNEEKSRKWIKWIFPKTFADGCREAMRKSYEKHVRLAKQGKIAASGSPHSIGLYGALGSRYRLSWRRIVEVEMWSELVPFLLMNESEAVEALAEYVVYQEEPLHVRVTWLKDLINSSLSANPNNPLVIAAILALQKQVAWCSLLEPATVDLLESAVKQHKGGISEANLGKLGL